MKRFGTHHLTACAVYATMVYAVTLISVKIPAPASGQGYIHLGDAFIYAAAAMLSYYAVFSAVIGSILADLTLGAPVYMPATAVIKALMVVVFVLIRGRDKNAGAVRLIAAMSAGALLMAAGYTLYEFALVRLGGMMSAEAAKSYLLVILLFNAIQGAISVPLGYVIIRAVNIVARRYRREREGD
ncbi:MAG: ECF transporter S component [Firmicutes bacterium]|nr:ECF transporter S component [Bacillota bacterium]